ncbi:inositol monophosphatase family protein [Sporosarcina thermotolerans]|uniref:inositol-phosphate phosphatase n=1 Tax=Sporosarcina thermotolerans TaxID=633404 RepID=A0AAW9A4Z0_9BACL|nr:inositol monophosphatase family protein [Sporosarcina thermotolerans]MDW0115865.1 inositol monophosphatase family protein [Sporosarcina thermotolerans]WHT46910.1 inositol monophosphatase family protein [Sporosarcina thermotolerans]
MNWGAIDRYAKSLIKEAGHKIRVSFYKTIDVESKAEANDLVTNIDRDIEQFFIRKIREKFPDHRIFGEEGFGDEIKSLEGVIWMLDPIDGTMNFIHQKRNFAISLGIYLEGVGILGYIYDVMNDDFYHAVKGEGAYFNDERLPMLENTPIEEAVIGVNASWVAPNRRIEHMPIVEMVHRCRGTRSYGSAAIELAYVSSGRIDAYMSLRLSPWDIAGGMVIAQEVGAIATNMKGENPHLLGQDTFIVAKSGLHEEILKNYIVLK